MTQKPTCTCQNRPKPTFLRTFSKCIIPVVGLLTILNIQVRIKKVLLE